MQDLQEKVERVCAKVSAGGEMEPVCLHSEVCTLRQAMLPLIHSWKGGAPPINVEDLAKVCRVYLRGGVLETDDDRVLIDKEVE